MILPLARLPLARLTRTPRSWLPIAGWTALAVLAAYVAHANGNSHAADRALVGPFGGIALPLLVYGVVSASLGGESLVRSGKSLVSFGASPSRVATISLVVAAAVSALLSAAVGAIVTALAHGAADPPLGQDLVTSAWIGALGGVAYAALFTLGASFGARGAGRTVVLVLDWVFGSGTGALSLVTPRAHVRNLLGGEASLELLQRASVTALLGLTVLFGAVAVYRARR